MSKIIKIENKEYNIPTTYSDLTLKKFLQLRDHEKEMENIPLFEYNLEYLSIVTEITHEDLLKLTPTEITNLIKELITVTQSELELVDNLVIKIDDLTYAFDSQMQEMKIGQFIDLDMLNQEGDVWDNAHRICASFLRPIKISKVSKIKLAIKKLLGKKVTHTDYNVESYNYENLLKRAEIFYQQLPMTYIYTIITFFLLSEVISHNSTQDSSPVPIMVKE